MTVESRPIGNVSGGGEHEEEEIGFTEKNPSGDVHDHLRLFRSLYEQKSSKHAGSSKGSVNDHRELTTEYIKQHLQQHLGREGLLGTSREGGLQYEVDEEGDLEEQLGGAQNFGGHQSLDQESTGKSTGTSSTNSRSDEDLGLHGEPNFTPGSSSSCSSGHSSKNNRLPGVLHIHNQLVNPALHALHLGPGVQVTIGNAEINAQFIDRIFDFEDVLVDEENLFYIPESRSFQAQPSTKVTKLKQILDKTTLYTKTRWLVFLLFFSLFIWRVVTTKGFYLVAYGSGIMLLNLVIGFLTPAVDPQVNDNRSFMNVLRRRFQHQDAHEDNIFGRDFGELSGLELSDLAIENSNSSGSGATSDNGEFRPFQRRVSEFALWQDAMKTILLSIFLTCFTVFDLPVFWPLLLLYFIMLTFITMKERIKHMIAHRYVPFSYGKKVYRKVPSAVPEDPESPTKRENTSEKHKD